MTTATARKTSTERTSLACWCTAGHWLKSVEGRTFRVLRCSACGCHRIDPPPVDNPADLGSFYTGYYQDRIDSKASEKPSRVARTSRFWRVAHRFPALLQSGRSALDIGCGDGTLCAELHQSGWKRVTGIDMSAGRIALARQRHPKIQFYDVSLQESGLLKSSTDLAVLDNVIEHVPDPVELLRAIREKLVDGGRLVLITPNMESGNFRLLGSRWTQELAPHVHIFLFTPASLCQVAQMAGYDVEVAGTFHLDPYPLNEWMARWRSGDVKGALWRTFQGVGNLYSRLIGSGPMVYAVARKSADGFIEGKS